MWWTLLCAQTRMLWTLSCAQPEFPLVRPNAAHPHRALQRRLQLLRSARVRGVQLHRRPRRALHDRLPVRRLLLFPRPNSRIPVVSGAAGAPRVAVRAGPDIAVSVSVLHPPVHPRRPYPAVASADQHQGLARRGSVLVVCRVREYSFTGVVSYRNSCLSGKLGKCQLIWQLCGKCHRTV